VNTQELQQCLRQLYPTRRPVFIVGKPGIGKSSLVRDVATHLGIDYRDFRTTLMEPGDLRGLPRIDKHGTHWVPPAELPRTGAGILMLEELPQADKEVQKILMQFTLDRRIGDYVLPPDWWIVALGNRVEDRSGANKLLAALANRFIHLNLDVNADTWLEWANQQGIDPRIRAYIRYRPDMLLVFPPSNQEQAFPSPRSWHVLHDVLQAIPLNDESPVIREVVQGIIGESFAYEFCAYVQLLVHLPNVEEILQRPASAPLPPSSEASLYYALCSILADTAKRHVGKPSQKTIWEKIGEYAIRFPAEFAVSLTSDLLRLDKPTGLATQSLLQIAKKHARTLQSILE
jgi:hypothetical protein